MPTYFSVKCKRCGALLQTQIELCKKNSELDKLLLRHKVLCPQCKSHATYSPDDYFLNQ